MDPNGVTRDSLTDGQAGSRNKIAPVRRVRLE
jgi:hypothetical protein